MISLAMVYIWQNWNKEDQAKYIGVQGVIMWQNWFANGGLVVLVRYAG